MGTLPHALLTLLPAWPTLSAFILASLLLAFTPGPAVVYIVAHSLSQGRRAGIVSATGVALGNFGNLLAAAFGLGALLAVSSTAYSAVKLLGAIYLIYLGAKLLRSATREIQAQAPTTPRQSLPAIFRDSFFVALLNPKTTLFFAAFLPQFLVTGTSPVSGTLTLGSIFVLIAAISDSAYALAAGSMTGRLSRIPAVRLWGNRAAGATFIGLGLFAALSDNRANGH